MTSMAASAAPVPIAVLGDSDSHAFHDTLMLGSGTPAARGGRFHDRTWQWTEVLVRLRGPDIDLGPWGAWGVGPVQARLQALAGGTPRGPRKEDFANVFAISGARCRALNEGAAPQVPALLARMAADPAAWQRGLVVIRIGINDLGTEERLAGYAQRGLDDAARRDVDGCIDAVGRAAAAIRARHAQTRLLLVGILDNADWPRLHGRWQAPEPLARISAVLDAYDDGLRAIATRVPGVLFHDDRRWFRSLWGGRGPDGRPAYRAVSLGGPVPVTMTEGDSPEHAVIGDGHAGTVWNALWAREMVRIIDRGLGVTIVDIADAEIARLADPDGASGLGAGVSSGARPR